MCEIKVSQTNTKKTTNNNKAVAHLAVAQRINTNSNSFTFRHIEIVCGTEIKIENICGTER